MRFPGRHARPGPPGSGRPRARLPLPRRTVRLRLTLLYSGLFLVSGAGLLAITYILFKHRIQVSFGPRAHGVRVTVPAGGPGQPRPAGQRETDLLLAESVTALIVMAVASIGLGWLVAGRVLGPLRTITAAARRISARSLDERLALTGPADELKELGDTFDGLLGRLEASFRAQRQFVANASHELRTPLARQRTLIEVALADPQPTVASLQAACRRALAAGERQERLIEALLTLARGERGLDRREPLDLGAVTGEVLRTRRDEARARGVRLDTALAPAMTLGDSRLAERLVANLVDNAVRHNQPGGRAEVVTGTSAGHAILRVTNTGPLVPSDQVDRLFQPFQRLGAERAAAPDGLGLGLPVVAAIAAAHGADLQARPLPAGGLAIEVQFPGPPREPPATAA